MEIGLAIQKAVQKTREDVLKKFSPGLEPNGHLINADVSEATAQTVYIASNTPILEARMPTEKIIEIVGIIATVLAVVGVITNNRRLRVCFLLWLISNALSGAIHAHAAIWCLVVRDAIFFVLAIEGWFKWGHKCKQMK